MSSWADRAPGVYREDRFLKPEPKLPTGVAGFVGFGRPRDPGKRPVAPCTPIALHHREDFALCFEADKDSYLADAVIGFFANGGARCYVAYAERTEQPPETNEKRLEEAIDALVPLNDLDVIAVPDAAILGTDAMADLQGWLLRHCAEHGDRFAILDMPKDVSARMAEEHRAAILTAAIHPAAAMSGALYYPWVTDSTSQKPVPPCGHVAGIYARSDARVGVFKAPANEEVQGAIDLEIEVTNDMQERFNPLGINCLRSFPGRGLRVWGARTLSEDPQWRYINVRRLFITVRRWIEATMAWAVFEPNTPELRARIQRELGGYLSGLWRLGALQGRTAEQAFYVKCDAETHPPDAPPELLVTEIGLAPMAPAEFVVVRIVHRTPLTTSTGSG
ncbi:MAG: phage tail sheath family protein [Gammaproteobacteria bacterium]